VRVSKSSPIFEALGMLDELNTITGWCKVACGDRQFHDQRYDVLLRNVQDHLFTVQAEVAGAPKNVPAESAAHLSALIDSIEKELPPITTFLVPGGTELSARLDIARAVTRRVERRIVTLHESGDRTVSETSRAYLNRLSSFFYALVRYTNYVSGVSESPPNYQ